MIHIYSREHLARALWADDEEAFRRAEAFARRPEYRPRSWDAAHDLDRQEYLARADRIVQRCQAQEKE